MLICFVILHYMDDQTTIECVNSILDTTKIENYKIIVVDNASKNGSYERMREYFGENSKIDWIKNEKNYGFSIGNNIGYRHAKKNYNPQFVLIGNNDLVFHQEDFVQTLEQLSKEYPFHVAGPDIVNLKGIHQSPNRMQLCSAISMKKKTRNRKILLSIFKTKKRIPALKRFDVIERIYFGRTKKTPENTENKMVLKNVVLHGACIIFSKRYMDKHEDAFPEYTFLYMEEDILALRCKKLGYDTYYFPTLKVEHKEDVSTNSVLNNELEKNIFVFSEQIKSAEIYLELEKRDVI